MLAERNIPSRTVRSELSRQHDGASNNENAAWTHRNSITTRHYICAFATTGTCNLTISGLYDYLHDLVVLAEWISNDSHTILRSRLFVMCFPERHFVYIAISIVDSLCNQTCITSLNRGRLNDTSSLNNGIHDL